MRSRAPTASSSGAGGQLGGQRVRRPGHQQDPGQAGDGLVSGRRRAAVPGRVDDLQPLVGADDHGVVAGGHVGDELAVGDPHPEPGPGGGDRLEHRHAGLERRTGRVFAQGTVETTRSRRSRPPCCRAASAMARWATVGGLNVPG